MEIRYIITNQHLVSGDGTRWAINEWRYTPEKISIGCMYVPTCYKHPLIVAFSGLPHPTIKNPKMFKAEVKNYRHDAPWSDCWGKTRLIEKIKIPKVTETQRIAANILYAQEFYTAKEWNEWATNWLLNKDRSKKSAHTAYFVADKESFNDEKNWRAAKIASEIACYVSAHKTSCTPPIYLPINSTYDKKTVDIVELAKKALKY